MATTKIRSSSILDGQVANADLSATVAVTGGQIADDAVTLAKMAGGTDGNLITYDASGDPAYVATGSATNILTSNGAGAAPTFQAAAAGGSNAPYFYAHLSADDTTPGDNAWTKVKCNTVAFETGTTYDETTNYRWTPAAAGKYYLYGQVKCTSDSSYKLGEVWISFYKNGVELITMSEHKNENTSYNRVPAMSALVDMNDTDYVEFWARMNYYSGVGRFVGGTDQQTHFLGYKLID